jgi:GTP-binding protein Era
LSSKPHRSGFVAILGKPNAGKSTLLNALLGQKLSIITPKAQTTRHRILGFDNGEDYQIVYSDTPGLIRPKYRLQEKMMDSVGKSLEGADLVVLLVAADETFPEEDLLQLAAQTRIPKILALNKVDIVSPEKVEKRIKSVSEKVDFVETIALSALNSFNVKELRELILLHLPEGPPYYDKESLSDRPERFFVSEIVREKIFEFMEEEIPYSCEVDVIKFDEDDRLIRIMADIHVERRTQKGMIIGKGGSMLKKIGTAARHDLETFLDKKVFLELYVRVTEGWKDKDTRLKGFGY